jgi:nitroreductase
MNSSVTGDLYSELVPAAIRIACRAPSLHNSQPWRWVAESNQVRLYHDADRMLPFTDNFGRQMIISCGAVLHHARVAFAALGWHVAVERFPDPGQPRHLATVTILEPAAASGRDLALCAAIARRRTDRLPFDDPHDDHLLAEMRSAAAPFEITVDTVPATGRAALASASETATTARDYDHSYQDELRWWTGHEPRPEGISRDVLPSGAEQAGVRVARRFPTTERTPRSATTVDRSEVLVLATERDSQPNWLRTGEALSAVLLACTVESLATCPLTHLTELPECRSIVAGLLPSAVLPQVLVRVGRGTNPNPQPATHRRPLKDVLYFVA